MRRIVVVLMVGLCLGLAGCGSLTSSGGSSDPCPNGEVCGNGCMPTGADCCPSGEGYCDVGSVCNSNNMCESDSGDDDGDGGGGGGGGGGDGEVATNCSCPGDNQCSQLVACLQSCTCYYTISGSDGTSAWYLVRTNYSEDGTCYMCDQVGLAPDCDDAAQSAATAAASLAAAGQCSY